MINFAAVQVDSHGIIVSKNYRHYATKYKNGNTAVSIYNGKLAAKNDLYYNCLPISEGIL